MVMVHFFIRGFVKWVCSYLDTYDTFFFQYILY